MKYFYIKILKIVLYIIFVVGVYIVSLYNYILVKKNKVNNAYSSLDIMLKRRYDLIPNLVSVVKEYTKYENKILNHLVELRNELIKSNKPAEIARKNNYIDQAIKSIFVHVEKYPDLKASEQYLNLQKNLTETENHISAARRTYNAHVTKYNNTIETFPNIIFSKLFGFKKIEWFEFDSPEKEKVKVYEDDR